MVVEKAWSARTLGWLVLAAMPLASRAGDGALRCDPASAWRQFSAASVTVDGGFKADDGSTAPLTLEWRHHSDGTRAIVAQGGRRAEEIRLRRASVALDLTSDGSPPSGSVIPYLGIPVEAMQRSFDGPCQLQPDTRYPIDFATRDGRFTGEFQRGGDVVRYVVNQTVNGQTASFKGYLAYEASPGPLPSDIAIRGWTIHHSDRPPYQSEPSRLDTLGELRDSLVPAAAR